MNVASLFCIDARDLRLEVLSSTSLNATVILPVNSAADYVDVYMNRPAFGGYCTVYRERPPYSCIYKDLKPGQNYQFAYSLGRLAGSRDISSKMRYKAFTMPA